MKRRALLWAAVAAAPAAGADEGSERLLRQGGVVVAFRHALAPGNFDPPGLRLDDCSTQRNLSDEGRAQARRIGEWFRTRGLEPARVRSSPWCRCAETARLAFGDTEIWPALGSPRAGTEATNRAFLDELRGQLQQRSRMPGRFEAWVTHMFVLNDLAATGTASGEGLVLQADADGRVRVLGRIVAS